MITLHFIQIKDIYKNQKQYAQKEIVVAGWIRTIRSSKAFGFLELNDGTFFKNMQIVLEQNQLHNFADIVKWNVGTSIIVKGILEETPNAKQPFELKAKQILLEGSCDSSYPLQKKRHSFEYLRKIAYLRPRTNTFSAVFRVRSLIAYAIHTFFQQKGFVYVHTPIITGSDCEGAGEMFSVTTLPLKEIQNMPVLENGDIDFTKDFFGKQTNLTVSGQLSGETFAMAFRNIYTFGPTFRAEESKGRRHMTEFWMMEPEMAWMHQDESLDIQQRYLAYMVKQVLENNEYELKILGRDPEKLRPTTEGNFTRLSYDDAIKMLQEAGRDIKWGDDFGAPDEGYISEQYDRPVFIMNYPTSIKPFYMKKNPDNPKEYLCADVIAPEGYGEIFGGSEREGNYEVLKQQIEDAGLNLEDYQWYLDLRKFGGVPHSGFGMGFERTIAWICKLDHIREAIPFPRLINRMQP